MALTELLSKIPGQDRIVQELELHLKDLRNSYFLIGSNDSGVLDIALGFAKGVLCQEGGCGICTSCVAIAHGVHPDVTVFERTGASILVEDGRDIVRWASRSTSGSAHKVIIVPEIELARKAIPTLLKIVEEPPAGTVFVLVASVENPDLVTLMSRSVVLKLDPISDDQIVNYVVRAGYDEAIALSSVELSGGRFSRALDLAEDAELRHSLRIWRDLPELLEPDMTILTGLSYDLVATVSILENRRKREHKIEIESVQETAKKLGVKETTLLNSLKEKHKRELRRLRTDEMRYGLLVVERQYRNIMCRQDSSKSQVRYCMDVIGIIEESQRALKRNANEFLILMSLLSRLAEKSS